jgi:hypothetical protein
MNFKSYSTTDQPDLINEPNIQENSSLLNANLVD